MRKIAVVVAVVAALAMSPASRSDMFKPSKADQVKLGKRASDDIRKKEKMLPDSDERVILMRRIAGRLLATVKDSKDPWEYSFNVVKSKQVNAFALPGGPVFFYSALVDQFKTEDEFAAVLAHELTHVRKEHWAYAYADNQKRRLGLSIVLMVFKANSAVFDVASIGDDLLFGLPYSRKHEDDADSTGCDMMVAAGFNPQGMIDVFETLRKASGKSKPPEFLSDHPGEARRIKRIGAQIAKMNRTFPAQTPATFKRD